jgi:hypothetical protein
MIVHMLPIALLHSLELPAGPGALKQTPSVWLHSGRSWQLLGKLTHCKPPQSVDPLHSVTPSLPHVPVKHVLLPESNWPPLLKQSSCAMQSPTVRPNCDALPVQTLSLQSWKTGDSCRLEQKLSPTGTTGGGVCELMMQLRAAAVS